MIAVTGANGLLGYDIMRYLNKNNIDALPLGRNEMDFTDKEAVVKVFGRFKPDKVIHCGAYSKVDLAEDEKELCFKTNVLGTENIVSVCRQTDTQLMYISTDYVFDGLKDDFYKEEDAKNPLSVYGRSKADAEDIIINGLEKYYIIRTSWLFGLNGKNFVNTIINIARHNSEISVVDDQKGSPTYTVDLVKVMIEILNSDRYGIYNATNRGECSWACFAQEIINKCALNCKVNYISSEEFGARALRPKNSMLSKDKLLKNGFSVLPHWKDALERYLKVIKEQI